MSDISSSELFTSEPLPQSESLLTKYVDVFATLSNPLVKTFKLTEIQEGNQEKIELSIQSMDGFTIQYKLSEMPVSERPRPLKSPQKNTEMAEYHRYKSQQLLVEKMDLCNTTSGESFSLLDIDPSVHVRATMASDTDISDPTSHSLEAVISRMNLYSNASTNRVNETVSIPLLIDQVGIAAFFHELGHRYKSDINIGDTYSDLINEFVESGQPIPDTEIYGDTVKLVAGAEERRGWKNGLHLLRETYARIHLDYSRQLILNTVRAALTLGFKDKSTKLDIQKMIVKNPVPREMLKKLSRG